MAKDLLSTVSIEQVGSILENTTSIARKLSISEGRLKPCIAQMMEEGLSKGEFPDRNTGAVIIAGELRRIDIKRERIFDILREWNYKNEPSLNVSRIQSAVNSDFRNKYNYGCKREELKVFCPGEEFCNFAKSQSTYQKKFTNLHFIDFGWQLILKPVAKSIYYISLPILETRHGVGIGGTVHCNYIQIAKLAGVSTRSVKTALLELRNTPLIERCEIGVSRKWERKATTIKRTIPIPKPRGAWLERIERKRKNFYGLR